MAIYSQESSMVWELLGETHWPDLNHNKEGVGEIFHNTENLTNINCRDWSGLEWQAINLFMCRCNWPRTTYAIPPIIMTAYYNPTTSRGRRWWDDWSYLLCELCIKGEVKETTQLLQHFQYRWKKEYLTSLREVHKVTGTNIRTVKVGNVFLIHDDTPRMQ